MVRIFFPVEDGVGGGEGGRRGGGGLGVRWGEYREIFVPPTESHVSQLRIPLAV